MAILDKVKLMLQTVLEEFVKQISTDKGLLQYDADELEVGVRVSLINEEGEAVTAEDGDYKLEDDRILVVADGAISEIKEPENENNDTNDQEEFSAEQEEVVEEEPVAVETDNEHQEEETTAVEEDPEEQKEEETEETLEETPAKQAFNKIVLAFEASYQEKEHKILTAIRSKGFEGYLVEAGDDFAIVEVWVNDGYLHYKFPVSWDGEEAVVGDPVEVKSEYVPVNEVFSKEEKQSLENQISVLQVKISELETKPAATPAKQAFRNTAKTTDEERLDNFINKYCK